MDNGTRINTDKRGYIFFKIRVILRSSASYTPDYYLHPGNSFTTVVEHLAEKIWLGTEIQQ